MQFACAFCFAVAAARHAGSTSGPMQPVPFCNVIPPRLRRRRPARTGLAFAALIAGLGLGCSTQVSDPDELGPRRAACAPVGACRPCPCSGYNESSYQLCDGRGYFVGANGVPGCTCPPPPASEVPPQCVGTGSGSAGAGGR